MTDDPTDIVFIEPYPSTEFELKVEWNNKATLFLTRWHAFHEDLRVGRLTRLSSDSLEKRLSLLEEGLIIIMERPR